MHMRPNSLCYSPLETGTADFGDLPSWDLSDLYASQTSQELKDDLNWLETEIRAFAEDYKGKLEKIATNDLLRAISRYEKIQNITGRLMSFAGLSFYQNTTDPERAKFMADLETQITDASAPLVFFTLELNRMENEALDAHFSENADLERYKAFFDRLRAFKPYQLSDELENFLHDQSLVGAAAWNRLFDETMARTKVTVGDATLGLEEALNTLTSADRAERQSGFEGLADVFEEKLPLFSRISNTLIKEKEIEDKWRKLPTPQASRHLSNHVEPEVVDALHRSVMDAYPDISHRYYRMKAQWLGLEKLELWDRNAPLPEADAAPTQWDEAKDLVLRAYNDFDPRVADIAKKFFDNDWIDAGVKPGKAPGAFAHPTVTNAHPYVMLNYMGKTRDVMTLAHELGHGVHQYLAAHQGELLAGTPLTLAETASVFGEMLTFKSLMREAKDPALKRTILAGKVEDMINTVVRQIAFYDFECRVHEERRNGELTPETFNAIWMETQKQCLGDAFVYPENYGTFWTYIPHFIHTPFYVYAYAFGDGLVNALYAVYEDGAPDFQEKYLSMLSAGGTKHHKDLLAPFGLDPTSPTFWDKGLNLISTMIDELEAMGNP